MFPRFRIMAVSMERLQIRVARISAITVHVIHFNPVVMLEEQSTVPTATVLRFEQLGQSRTGTRMPSLSDTPVHPIPIVRAKEMAYLAETPQASSTQMEAARTRLVELLQYGQHRLAAKRRWEHPESFRRGRGWGCHGETRFHVVFTKGGASSAMDIRGW